MTGAPRHRRHSSNIGGVLRGVMRARWLPRRAVLGSRMFSDTFAARDLADFSVPRDDREAQSAFRCDRIIDGATRVTYSVKWRNSVIRNERPFVAPRARVAGPRGRLQARSGRVLQIAGYDVSLAGGPVAAPSHYHHPHDHRRRRQQPDHLPEATRPTSTTRSSESSFQWALLAVCDRVPGERFYVAHVYHEWFRRWRRTVDGDRVVPTLSSRRLPRGPR